MSSLALLGGKPVCNTPFPPWRSLGEEEVQAGLKVLKSGVLSSFVGTWSKEFSGGMEVRSLEKEWALHFRTRHAIAVNSATSGLYAAMGAIGIGPGDEVIVTPTSMSASATAPLVYGGIPVFADILQNTYMLDPRSIEARITPKTRAIIVVNLFGHSADMEAILLIAKRRHLFVIEDNAQAPGAVYQSRYAGTWGHIGVFSLNYHKHIHTGEGGVCVTNDAVLANRLKLIRNHAEAVIDSKGYAEEDDLTNMIGWNYRMTEIEAAIGRQQLKKLTALTRRKQGLGNVLRNSLLGMESEGLHAPHVGPNATHVYYTFPLRIEPAKAGVSRALFVQALQAEGVPAIERYAKPLYLSPLFQKRIAMGGHGFPFTLQPERRYTKGLCPTAERLYQEELFYIPWCSYEIGEEGVRQMTRAIQKVWEHRNDLGEAIHEPCERALRRK